MRHAHRIDLRRKVFPCRVRRLGGGAAMAFLLCTSGQASMRSPRGPALEDTPLKVCLVLALGWTQGCRDGGCASPSAQCNGHPAPPSLSAVRSEAACSQHSEGGGPGRPGVREDSQRGEHLKEDLPLQNVPFPSCPCLCSPMVPSPRTTLG